MIERVSVSKIRQSKTHQKITMVTAYDFVTAKICDDAKIDVILIGDSLGNICLGHSHTIPVTLDDMCHHSLAVSRGVKHGLVIADMPFGTVEVSVEKAKENALKLFQFSNVQALKIEAKPSNLHAIEGILSLGIPVMGHIGFTPQSVHQLGGYKVQGKSQDEEKMIKDLAKSLEDMGCFSILLELMKADLAKSITHSLDIPTIGIGAGSNCDGQVLAFHDLIGYENRQYPKFVKNYMNAYDLILRALERFKKEVQEGKYPEGKHGYN